MPTFVGVPGAPEGWGASLGTQSAIGLTSSEKHGGTSALYISGPVSVPVANATAAILLQVIRPELYRGKRVRFAAWVKPLGITSASYAGLWMRVDGAGPTLAFDNMFDRPVTGSGDWREIAIVLDVPQTALGIAIGVLFNAYGTLVLDDLRFEVVGTDVPVTAPVSPFATGSDSLTIASMYARAPSAPRNLDFEGLSGLSTQTVDWLSQNSVSLSTTDPTASLDDLEPLRQMVGSAHLVGLGEGTHGTREFFQMKHRMLEFLVTKMGFTYFAIEATSPESDDMNRYVLTGEGDPARLLSRLYFWTWNTQEVLDMVMWMRQWNVTAPVSQRVQFLGFDMQAPGASIDSVDAFLAVVDPTARADARSRYSCITPYRNNGPSFVTATSQYAALADNVKAACAAALKVVFDNLGDRKPAYEAASSPGRFAAALHAARLVQQFEAMITNTATSSRVRDASMAENITWIRDQAGPSAKIALWAHNAHINAVPTWMGGYLRSSFGSDYVNLGFAFGRGTFTAVTQTGTTLGPLTTWSASLIPKSSIEEAFDATAKPRLLLDMRKITSGGAAAAPLAGPINMRSIGATFDWQRESAYFSFQRFPDDFDLMIYLATTTASVTLPFKY
jgi:erythromycin esterase